MKKYIYISAPVILIFFFLILSIFNNSAYSKNSSENSEKINIEDAIIIRGINVDSPYSSENTDNEALSGSIIYDSHFEDSLSKRVSKKNKKKPLKKITHNWSIERLRKKDSRWHLISYRIKKNDNLWNIARRFGLDHRIIIRLNKIKSPDCLNPGQKINIPTKSGIWYIIRRGDTLTGISGRYEISAAKISAHNKLKSSIIRAGDKLFIPDAVLAKKKNHMDKIAQITDKPEKIEKYPRKNSKKSVRFSWPLYGKITSRFGERTDPFSGKRKFHCGIDISCNEGTVIRSSAPGKVIHSGWKGNYGKTVIIRHELGYITVYAHLSKSRVKVNDRIKRGMKIGFTGKSGAVTGAHLHFEIRKYITPLNPLRLLK